MTRCFRYKAWSLPARDRQCPELAGPTNLYQTPLSLPCHPGSGSSSAERRGQAQPTRTHGEIADEVPEEAGYLDDGREQGENRAVQL